jgi:hypothetical protein
MALSRWAAVVVLGGLAFGGGALADGPAAAPPPGAGAEASWRAEAFRALRIRMEARLEAGRLLEKQGRFDEALATYRTVDDLWTAGLRGVRDLAALEPEAGAREGPRMPPYHGPARDDVLPPPTAVPSDSRQAIAAALEWLAAHQGPDGSWEAGNPKYAVGVTGLAILPFLGAGITDRSEPFGRTVRDGLAYLLSVQDPEGCFGPRSHQHYVYDHALASLAVVEAYALTRSERLRTAAQKALDFVMLARNPYFAWRYGVKPGDNDTSVTSWMVLVLHAARSVQDGGFAIDGAAFEGARAWLEKMTDPDTGRTGYVVRGGPPARTQDMLERFPAVKSEAMTAAGLVIRLHTGEAPSSPLFRKGLDLVLRKPPVWNAADGSVDMYYWYFGTLAAFHAGGDAWRTWDHALRAAVLPAQRRDGETTTTRGSWDAVDPWGAEGGTVYATALMTLCLEISDRHARVAGR